MQDTANATVTTPNTPLRLYAILPNTRKFSSILSVIYPQTCLTFTFHADLSTGAGSLMAMW